MSAPRPMPETSTTSSLARSPYLAPAVVGVAGVLAGAGLVVALTGDDDGPALVSDSLPPTTTIEPASTGEVATTIEPAPTSEVVTTAASTETTPDTAPGPLRANAARIDGVTYIETSQCVTFPSSNPDAGIGDAHVNVSLHRVESTDGERVIVERWNEDGFASVGLVEPGGRSGRSVASDLSPPDGVAAETISMIDGTTVELEHTLTTGGSTCPSTLVTGVDEFSFVSLGAGDLCSHSGGGFVVTYQNGSMLGFAIDATSGTFAGELRFVSDDGSVRVAEVSGLADRDGDGEFLEGSVDPGITDAGDGATESLTVRYDSLDAGATCTAAQEAVLTVPAG